MEKEQLQDLFKKYSSGTCTEKEKALLEAWYLQYNEHEVGLSNRKIRSIGSRVFRQLPGNETSFINIGLKLAAAAVTIGILFTIALNVFLPKEKKSPFVSQRIVPGSNQAILTLSSGKKINLNKFSQSQLENESEQKSITNKPGQLIYSENTNGQPAIAENNITTPKGGQWQIILPDGSKVWLNSATSFDFPTSFKGESNRIVRLTGEAYFEIAKDKRHPFIVKSKGQEVAVLGTHFNINSYYDEPAIKTTLAEGRVKITTDNGKEMILSPGQEALLSRNRLSINEANLEESLAWKNGYFRFNDESISSVMRKLARWYNIEVKYISDTPNESLNGKISRTKNIDQVLKALETTKTVHFKVEGRRVTVMK